MLWILAAALVLVLVTAGWWFLVRDDGSDPTADDGGSGQSSQEPGTSSEDDVEVAGRASAKAPKTATPNEDVNGDQVSYDASNMLDGVPDTAWRAPGDGTGMKLTFTLREPTELHQVGLINGYAKTSTDSKGRTFDWYLGNRRIQSVIWVFDDGSKVRQQLTETRELQMVDVPDVVTRRVVLKLATVSAPGEGNAARDFTAISEVSFVGTLSPETAADVLGKLDSTAAAAWASSSDTSRCVTIRTAVGPTVATRTPCSAAAATNAAASLRSTTTMLVSTVAGSTPQASASSLAWAWSSASRSTWWSRACSPAAARMPTCRMPPPIRLRRTRASSIASREPTISEPTGAPSPLDRQTDSTRRDGAVLDERYAGGHVRVPDPGPVEVHAGTDAARPGSQLPQVLERQHRATGEVVGVLDRDRRGPHEERAHVGREHRPDRGQVRAAARVRPGAHRDPADRAVRAELGPGDVRRRLAEHLLPGRDQRADRQHVGHRPGRA